MEITAQFAPRFQKTQAAAALSIAVYAAAAALAPKIWLVVFAAPLILIPLAFWCISRPRRWLMFFFASAMLLPPLPFTLGNSGPHVAVLFAGLGIIAGLVRIGDWRLRFDSLSVSLLSFFSVLLVSVAFAALYSGAAIAAASLSRVLLFGTGCYGYFYTAHGPEAGNENPIESAKLLFFAAIAASLFACVDFYYQFPAPAGYGPQFVWLDTGVFRRAQGLFYEASTLGNFCAFFLVMVAASLFRARGERPCSRWVLIGGGAVLSAALIFSYSRASLLNVCSAMIALMFVRRVRWRRAITAAVICAVAGAVIVYTAFPSFAQNYWMRLANSLQYFWSSPEGVLSGRLASWRTLAAFLAGNPWFAFFGIGYKTLPYSDFLGNAVIADNMYLSLLVETGMVGLGAFLALNWAILRRAFLAARSEPATVSFFGTWIFCFWIGEMVQMLSGDLMTYWRVLPIYFWVLAIATRDITRDRRAA